MEVIYNITIRQLEDWIGVHRRTIVRWDSDYADFPGHIQDHNGHNVYNRAAVMDWLEAHGWWWDCLVDKWYRKEPAYKYKKTDVPY